MFGLIFVLIISLFVLGLVAGIFLWATGGPASKSAEMSCGACGYAVRGLQALNCPECGADLREVGINQPASGAGRKAGMILTVGCGGTLLVGGLGSVVFLGNSAPAPSSPATLSQPAPKPSISSPVQNADGSQTIHNPDGSQIVVRPDGSKTLIQPDGTMTTFDKDGVEIPNPEPD